VTQNGKTFGRKNVSTPYFREKKPIRLENTIIMGFLGVGGGRASCPARPWVVLVTQRIQELLGFLQVRTHRDLQWVLFM